MRSQKAFQSTKEMGKGRRKNRRTTREYRTKGGGDRKYN